MTGYRCDSGACPQVTYDGDTVTIVETASPGQVVVTSAAKWDAYLDTIRAEERKRIVAVLRAKAKKIGKVSGIDYWPWDDVADLIERGEIDDLAAGDE